MALPPFSHETAGMEPTTIRRGELSPSRALIQLLWRQALWAIPFALFFGTMFGSGFASYVLSYKMSLVFAYLIGLGLWIARYVFRRDYYTGDGWERVTPLL